jgi:methyl-accepting chemotaxis protein
MKTFLNLRLAVRLGVAFGSLSVALAIIAAVGINGVGAVDEDAERLSGRDIIALENLVAVSEDFMTSGYKVVRHLYVEDGDLAAQDETANEIATLNAEAKRTLAELEPKMQSEAGARSFEEFASAIERFETETAKAIEISRQETVGNVEERDGSRDAYAEQIVPVFENLDKIHDRLEAAVVGQAQESAKEAGATAASVRRTVLIVAILAALIAIGLAFITVRSIVRPVAALGERLRSLHDNCLTSLDDALGAVSEGDLTNHVVAVTTPVTVESRDEIGQLSATFNQMLEKMQGSIESYGTMRRQLGSLILDVSANAGTVSAASQQMASTSDEAGRAVGEIASAVTDVAQGAERQVRMVEATREAVQEAARAAAASSVTAESTAEAAEQAREAAREGVSAASQATEAIRQVADNSAEVGRAIEDLSAKSERIGGIVDTITGIAEQTNLLALNAAIEAARAGEQGRGFAVVAEEVRKLAEESQQAAAQISGLIGEIQTETGRVVAVVGEGAKRTADGVATVEQAREAFEVIGAAVESMTERVAEIAAAVAQISSESSRAEDGISEVAAVAEQSSASAEEVSASTEETSASTEEIAASAQSLAATAEQLDTLVRRFKVSA